MVLTLERVGNARWKVRKYFQRGRFDLPIIIRHDGVTGRAWVNAFGWLDRSDGPALEWQDGDKEWWKDGWIKGREARGRGSETRNAE